MLTGCISVAPWLHAQPAYFCRRIGADRACVGNILAGGNDGAVRQVLPSTVMQGRPRETFGVFAGRSSAGRSIDGAAGRSTWRGGSDLAGQEWRISTVFVGRVGACWNGDVGRVRARHWFCVYFKARASACQAAAQGDPG
jgi:hypothetical protein